jgi:7-cyano-7-deazaguanine synthase
MNAAAESARAVVLVSGGLDSATVLAIAREQGFACYALSIDYGQRHRAELASARRVAASQEVVRHEVFRLDLSQFGGSALTDGSLAVPDGPQEGIPITYVPARNTIFLAVALGWAEVLGARDLFIGANAVDYSGYPDCRPAFIQAFTELANLATKAGVEGERFSVHAPLIDLSKSDLVQRGMKLGVDFGLTLSCYDPGPGDRPCGVCDACRLRARGFAGAGIQDPGLC